MLNPRTIIRRGIIIALTANPGICPGVSFKIMKVIPDRKYNTEKILVFIL
jgi:hypothetical protein